MRKRLAGAGALRWIVWCLWAGSIAYAQVNTADILGTVTDAAGAVVPTAKVTVENLATHEIRTTQSSGSGDYVVNLLQPGQYTVSVEAPSFKKATINLTLTAGDRARADVQLQVGEVTQVVEVAAQSPALQTDSATLRTVVTEQAVQDLPLNGRNYITLVQSTVGVGVGPSNSILSGTRPDERRQTANVTANGQNEVFNNQLIDGMDNNEREQFTILMRPSIDMISEVKVETNAYSAELGRAGGAVINLITKSGTNEYHGGAYEYFRNDKLNANDFFSNAGGTPRPDFHQNQFGGSFGGPIRRNKTFFFADAEALRIVQGQPTGLLSVPTRFEELNPGNFSDQGGPVLPPSQLDPVALNYWKLWPAPNVPGAAGIQANYSGNVKKVYNSTTYDARLDHHFTDSDSFFARFSYNPTFNSQPALFPDVNGISAGSGIFPGPSYADSQGYMMDYVHIFSPTLVMEAKAGFIRLNLQTLSPNQGTNASQKFGMPNADVIQQISVLATIQVSGFQAPGSSFTLGDDRFVPIYDINNVFQYQGSLTWTRGAHNIKFGGGVIRRQLNYYQNTFGLGYFQFLSDPLTNLENLLLGKPTQIQRQVNFYKQYFRFWEPSVYTQDDWRVNRWLTLNLGLRWDYFSPITSATGQRANFDLGTLTMKVGSNPGPVQPVYTNFEPRFGFAATTRRAIVIRGGFGMSRFPQDYASGALNLLNAPFVSTNFNCQPAATSGALVCPPGIGTLAAGPPLGVIPPLNNLIPGVLGAHDTHYPQAYIMQYNLTFQKQFGQNVASVGYVGELARHLQYAPNENLPDPSPGALNPFYYSSLLPNVSNINHYTATGAAEYNAMELVFERRYSKGITVNANYTFARNLTNMSDGGTTGAATVGGILPRNRSYDWGNSDIGIKHRFSFRANYELPFGKSVNGWRKFVYGGWQANTLAFWQSGTPFTVLDAAFNPAPTNVTSVTTDRPNTVPGQSYVPANQSITNWINLNAFTIQPKGTPGNEARTQLYGPTQRSVDFSLFKDFPFRERMKLQFRAEVYNISNTENFGQPNITITKWNGTGPGATPTQAGNFGQIIQSNLALNPRQFQFALKLVF